MKLIWSEQARDSLREIYEYIYLDSPTAAKHVKQTFLAAARSLINYPERYSVESANDYPNERNIRFYPKWSYRMIYEVKEDRIIIIDVFHASQHPDKLKL